jgi:phenylpropionate dioxygenase-like ring-hydroxylating dioxygenase large terminal subunit
MLSKEDNAAITAVGPGTLMGTFMRQYWIPVAASSELLQPDGDPLRVRLLGEDLIAFRDSTGQVGLVHNNCPHRGASLFFGRNEESGLRCVYHGWKFATDGTCVDMPNEPAESDFRQKVKAAAYPTRERNGIVWCYMGLGDSLPQLPDLEANCLPDGEWSVSVIQRECNWLQGLEGEIDTSHLGFLHGGQRRLEDQKPGTFAYYTYKDRAPRYSVVDTDCGVMYGAYREAEPDTYYWRIAQFLFPMYAFPPSGVLGTPSLARAWVPMDDTHTLMFSMTRRGVSGNAFGIGSPFLPSTTDWYGRFRLAINASNDYAIDRDKQRSNQIYCGIPGGIIQDQAITGSMGPLYDRSQERLATSDVMIIRVRRALLAAARAFADTGRTPPGANEPTLYRVRAGGIILPKSANWVEDTAELRRAFTEHPELDLSIGGVTREPPGRGSV